jgi:hypothetical protein
MLHPKRHYRLSDDLPCGRATLRRSLQTAIGKSLNEHFQPPQQVPDRIQGLLFKMSAQSE